MTNLLLIAAAFFLGAVPFAVWLGWLALRIDIRRYGDGNPGTFNALRAGGVKWGTLALLLEVGKGLVPVALARFGFGVEGPMLALVALAPVVGHAFSPFLRFRGGKAVAVTFGAWIGLTIWEGPTVFGILLGFWYSFVAESGWAVICAWLSFGAYLLLTQAEATLLIVWLGILGIFLWKHRAELGRLPTLKAWYLKWGLPWRTSS